MTKLRQLPHDPDVEAAVCAALLSYPEAFDQVASLLKSEHFYNRSCARIFEAAVDLQRTGQPVDIHTIGAWLRAHDRITQVGDETRNGVAYLSHLVESTPAVANLPAHAAIIVDRYRRRALIETCQLAAAEGYDNLGDGAQKWIDSVEQRVYKIARHDEAKADVQLYDAIHEELTDLMSGSADGVMTGFVDVDKQTTGMHPGELIIVAARPGMGKTAYALNIATHVARAPQGGCLLGAQVFSLEMPRKQLVQRLVCSEARADLRAYREKQLTQTKLNEILAKANELGQLPLWIDDTPAIGVLELRAKIRRRKSQFDKKIDDNTWSQRLAVVVVDYVQLMRGEGSNREQEIASITRGLKAVAKELGVVVIALSQLNRGVESRQDKRPQLSDLRESGSIEQDADCVQMLYRPEYYVTDKASEQAQKLKGYAEVIIGKQRNGPTGRIPITFLGESTKFENRAANAWRDEGGD